MRLRESSGGTTRSLKEEFQKSMERFNKPLEPEEYKHKLLKTKKLQKTPIGPKKNHHHLKLIQVSNIEDNYCPNSHRDNRIQPVNHHQQTTLFYHTNHSFHDNVDETNSEKDSSKKTQNCKEPEELNSNQFIRHHTSILRRNRAKKTSQEPSNKTFIISADSTYLEDYTLLKTQTLWPGEDNTYTDSKRGF